MPGEIAICFAAVTPFTIDIESMMGPCFRDTGGSLFLRTQAEVFVRASL